MLVGGMAGNGSGRDTRCVDEPSEQPIVLNLHPVPVEARVPFNPQTQVCFDCQVRRHALFGVLDSSALEQIHYHIADVLLEPGQRLYGASEHGQAAYTVREGVMRLERSSDRGERRIVRLAGRGNLVGMEAMLGQTYSADAIACTPARVCRLPKVLLDELSRAKPELMLEMMKRWQGALDEADEWLTELSTGSARWRMLRLLLKLSEYGGANGCIWLPSRQDMGAMLGMTVETASRLVSALKREGLLDSADLRHARIDMPALLDAIRREGSPA